MIVTESRCRDCASDLDTILDLGTLRLSTFPAPEVDLHRLSAAPLNFCRCVSCGLVQLRHTVSPDVLFRQYWYRSGINEIMRAELADVAKQAAERVGRLTDFDVVLDVGANDGTLLSTFDQTEAVRVAYEPALNLYAPLRLHCDVLISDYFPAALDRHKGFYGRVKILTSIACFYAVQDPHAFISAVAALLHPEGVWVVQFQDLHQMLGSTAFDNICHEHLFYPSLDAIIRLVAPHGLSVVAAERRNINGGSLRLTIQHGGHRIDQSVVELLLAEKGCEDWQTLGRFAWRVGEMREQIHSTLHSASAEGAIIDLYAASTKASTTFQYCGLGPSLIRQAWERTPEKVGRVTVTGIPIVSEETGRANPPDLVVVGAWQFKAAFVAREMEYLKGGGAMLFPLPTCDLVVMGKEEAAG